MFTNQLCYWQQGEAGKVALLDSHTFSSVGVDCIFTFWHFLATDATEPTSLELFRKTEADPVSVPLVSLCICFHVRIIKCPTSFMVN